VQPFDPATLKDLNQPIDFAKFGQFQQVEALKDFNPAGAPGAPGAPGQQQTQTTPGSWINPQVLEGLPQAEKTARIFAYLLEEPKPKQEPAPAPPTPNTVAKTTLPQFSPKDAQGTQAQLKALESKQFGFSQSAGLDSLLKNTKPAAPAGMPPGKVASSPAEQPKQQPVFTFLVNPQSLKWRRKAIYSDAVTAATSIPAQQYYYTTGRELQIEGVLMETWYLRRSLRPLLEQLQFLLVPDIPNQSLSPKVLTFCWGAQTFTPCVLTDLDWTEKSWLNGEPATVELSMTLLEIPPPDGDMVSRWAGEQKKITGPGDSQSGTPDSKAKDAKDPKGKKKIQPTLTDRQTQEASKKADDFLKSNKTKFDPQVQERLKSGNYQLQVDPKSGDVNLLNGAGGAAVGKVGNWDGTQFDTTKNSLKKAPTPKKK
jgi:Contractile injection system tube protein